MNGSRTAEVILSIISAQSLAFLPCLLLLCPPRLNLPPHHPPKSPRGMSFSMSNLTTSQQEPMKSRPKQELRTLLAALRRLRTKYMMRSTMNRKRCTQAWQWKKTKSAKNPPHQTTSSSESFPDIFACYDSDAFLLGRRQRELSNAVFFKLKELQGNHWDGYGDFAAVIHTAIRNKDGTIEDKM
jgi:hypothetical protein